MPTGIQSKRSKRTISASIKLGTCLGVLPGVEVVERGAIAVFKDQNVYTVEALTTSTGPSQGEGWERSFEGGAKLMTGRVQWHAHMRKPHTFCAKELG